MVLQRGAVSPTADIRHDRETIMKVFWESYSTCQTRRRAVLQLFSCDDGFLRELLCVSNKKAYSVARIVMWWRISESHSTFQTRRRAVLQLLSCDFWESYSTFQTRRRAVLQGLSRDDGFLRELFCVSNKKACCVATIVMWWRISERATLRFKQEGVLCCKDCHVMTDFWESYSTFQTRRRAVLQRFSCDHLWLHKSASVKLRLL
jgi:hypothetical protein